ncbi:MAG TPA: hypothetical protein VGV38_00035 [Pyrinomonadaceae bacterium]|nr:hypothetical protein [Pyrinomonadaceae bacterium]
MKANATAKPRFERRTELRADEYRTNFRQMDCDAIRVVTSREARRVTPLISQVYLCLLDAPTRYRERDGVLRFTGEERGQTQVTAWEALCELLGVASATARKALVWLHEQGVIGYSAGRNGVGIRVFLNRATSSIRARPGAGIGPEGQKILAFRPASFVQGRTSAGEVPFKDSFAVRDILELEIPRAPDGGAGSDREVPYRPEGEAPGPTEPNELAETHDLAETSNLAEPAALPEPNEAPEPVPAAPSRARTHLPTTLASACPPRAAPTRRESRDMPPHTCPPSHTGPLGAVLPAELLTWLKHELETAVERAAERAAEHEHERTREWLEARGLPKAARVAQREAYDVLRRYGLVSGVEARARAWADVGRAETKGAGEGNAGVEAATAGAGAALLGAGEVRELAEGCVAMFEAQGRPVEVTAEGMSVAAGGWLRASDAERVRELAASMLADAGGRASL